MAYKEFDVSEFNKKFEMTYNSTSYREDLRLDPGWVVPIKHSLSDETKILMYKRPYYHEAIAYIIRDIMKDNPRVEDLDELFYERFSDEDEVMNIDGKFRSGRL